MEQLIVAVFADEMAAKHGAQALKDIRAGGATTLNGMSVISKDARGKLIIGETIYEGTRGAVVAAFIGALAGGVAGGPVAAGIFAAGGALFGLSADLIHRNEVSDTINRVSQNLSPGKSAVIAHVSEHGDVDVGATMERLGGKLIMQKL